MNSTQFGKLFMLPVDDEIYAAVLYVSALQISGGTHNVIYVATMNNTVYAFDADVLGPPLWSRNFNGGGRPSVWSELGAGNCTNFDGNVGIVSTPVIDGVSRTIYFVTRTVESGTTVQRLRALDITTGNDRANSPKVISATASNNTFNASKQNQRSALALSQGNVYIAWASYCDVGPYTGWVMVYDQTSLAQVSVFAVTPSSGQAGIWMGGASGAFDASGNAYYATGNGYWDGVSAFGESVVKLAPGSLSLLDFFTPSDYATLNAIDGDLGSAGPSILPGTGLMVEGGKEGKIFVLNTINLGHEASGDVQIPQSFQAVDPTIRPGLTHHIHNANVAWNSPQGLNLYVWGENDFLHAFRFNTSTQKFILPAFASGAVLPPIGMPGGMLSVSANGSLSGSGVVWVSQPRVGDAEILSVPGNLYAFNAETLALLWSSTGTSDDLLSFSKGSIPVVANGKVYVGSLSRFVSVYGLKANGVVSQDLALNKTATGSAPCTPSQTPSQAVNGSFSGGLNDKFCSSAASPFLMVDLGGFYSVNRFVVEHAGAGEEDFSLNTRAFNIQVSTDGVNFVPVANVTGNVSSITTNDITPATARFVQLNIITPTQTTDNYTRIYEFQVFGSPADPSADFSLSATPGSQAFTFTFSDGAGWQNLGVLEVLINNVLDGRQACYVAYVAQSNSLFLVDDGGDAGGPFAGSMPLNGTGSVANGQCTVSGAGSSATGNGNTLTLTLKVSFSAAFAGNKVLYMAARDTGSGNSGWQAMGTWGVPGAAPSGPAVGGMNPARSSALSQTYTFTFTDSNGWQDIGVTDILINSALDGIGACYLAYVPSGATTGSVFLVDDAGDAGGPYAEMVLPGSGTVQNSQCTINGTGSSVTASGNTLTLNLAITFSSSFVGNQVFYLAARNNTTGNSGWQAVGSVTVP